MGYFIYNHKQPPEFLNTLLVLLRHYENTNEQVIIIQKIRQPVHQRDVLPVSPSRDAPLMGRFCNHAVLRGRASVLTRKYVHHHSKSYSSANDDLAEIDLQGLVIGLSRVGQ